MQWSRTVKQQALDLGFDLVGIAPVAVWTDLEFSRQWVDKGFNGEMQYLANPKRFDPRRVLPAAQSAICVALVYNGPFPYSTQRGQKSEAESPNRQRPSPAGDGGIPGSVVSSEPAVNSGNRQFAPHAWISRYAWGHDYHETMRTKLEALRAAVEGLAPGVETRVFVDTGPVIERALARFSALGWMGKNTCVINQEKGSWFFLGIILTSLELPPDLPAADRCGSCTACLDACPTGALVEPYVMDASRCISYFTIELKGSIPEPFRSQIGDNIFGCDICQDVCPWNGSLRQPAITKVPQFHPMTLEPDNRMCSNTAASEQFTTDGGQRTGDHEVPNTDGAGFSLYNPPLHALASLSEDDFRRIFAHSPIKRAKYRGWLRNLCVAMGNSGDERFLPWLEAAAQHSDSLVREHATWALDRLRGNGRPAECPVISWIR